MIDITPFRKLLDEFKDEGKYRVFNDIIRERGDFPKALWYGPYSIKSIINWCSNDYLGMGQNTHVVSAMHSALDQTGSGSGGTRNIGGTSHYHVTLEKELSLLHLKKAALLFTSAYVANEWALIALARIMPNVCFISDNKNHASLIVGINHSKAAKRIFEHNNMEDLEQQLIKATEAGHRFKLIVTDGVFSMDGLVAPLDKICDLADKYDAMVMVDECHAAGFIGATGKGTPEAKGVMGRVDIITGTLGKALGGAMGGYTTAKKEIIEILRQRSRPYLFSNSLAPAIVGASIKVFELLEKDTTLRDLLEENTNYFKSGMKKAGFDIIDGDSAIVPVMLYDAKLAQNMANELLKKGIYVIGFFFPVVPKEKARIRVQLSAAHTKAHLDKAIKAFIEVGKELNII